MIGAIAAGVFCLLLIVPPIFIWARWKKRREAQAAAWTQFAQSWGGAFANKRVVCPRGEHDLHLDSHLVSVMQAASSPYWTDGGTFTKASLVSRRSVSETSTPVMVGRGRLEPLVPEVAALSVDSRIIMEPQGCSVVMDGSVTNPETLQQAFMFLEGVERHVAAHGPFALQHESSSTHA